MSNDDPIWGEDGPPPPRSRPVVVSSRETPLLLRAARLPDPKNIPPREWLLGTHLLRGFVSVLVAPGGTGKSIYAMTMALSLATGRDLLGLKVWQQVNVSVYNEDPLDELDRRLAAILMRYKIGDGLVEDRYFLNSMDDRGVLMASRGSDGFTVVHPDEEALIEQIKANHIGLLVIDPYAESHTLEENSNPDMVRAAAAWRRVARATGCAILLVHHVRKGANDAGIDASRGAKGLTDSARVGLVMASMTEIEAKALNIPAKDRFGYVRIDDAKVNLSPRVDEAKWFRIETVELGNATEVYPNGDRIPALVPWIAPKLFSAITQEQIDLAMAEFEAGPAPGQHYMPTKKGNPEFWAGEVLNRFCDISDKQAQDMIDAWMKNGVLVKITFRNSRRKDVVGITINPEKRPGQ